MDDGRSGHHQDFSGALRGATHQFGDLANRDVLRLLTRHRAVHEAERVLPIDIAPHGEDARTEPSDNNLVAAFHLDHRHTACLLGCSIHRDAAVHLLPFDADPMPGETDLGRLVRRRIEALGKCTVHVGRFESAVVMLHRDRTVLADRGQNLFEARFGRSRHRQPNVARVVAIVPDADFVALVLTAEARDLVEHLRQQQAVDDVPREFNILAKRSARWRRTFGINMRTHEGASSARGLSFRISGWGFGACTPRDVACHSNRVPLRCPPR